MLMTSTLNNVNVIMTFVTIENFVVTEVSGQAAFKKGSKNILNLLLLLLSLLLLLL